MIEFLLWLNSEVLIMGGKKKAYAQITSERNHNLPDRTVEYCVESMNSLLHLIIQNDAYNEIKSADVSLCICFRKKSYKQSNKIN